MHCASSWALVVATLLAGCSQAPDTTPDGTTTITNPGDGRTDGAQGPHLHDYWQGAHRLTLLDEVEVDIPGILWLAEEPAMVAEFRLPPGTVVPQGARWINITLAWQPGGELSAANTYSQAHLYVKTAAETTAQHRADLDESGRTFTLESNNTANDLPHQVLSGWRVQLWMTGTQEVTGPRLSFQGSATATVSADRGLDIPVYPGHPDRWENRTEILLFEDEHSATFDGDPTSGNYRCFGGCPMIHVPADGAVVPVDAAYVRVELLTDTDLPGELGLKVHGATSYAFAPVDAVESSPGRRLYEIVVGDQGDGPYAPTSQWEFAPYVAGPVEDGLASVTYTLRAVAHRS